MEQISNWFARLGNWFRSKRNKPIDEPQSIMDQLEQEVTEHGKV